MSKIKISGYWTFYCNPKYWAIDQFLSTIQSGKKSEYRISSWQKDYFKKGQLGVIRVGYDLRRRFQLNGRERLNRGIYAIVEICGTPFAQSKSHSNFRILHQKSELGRFVIPIKYIRNYINRPVLLSFIENDLVIKSDPYLLKGFQSASMPLLEDVFNRILLYGEEELENSMNS